MQQNKQIKNLKDNNTSSVTYCHVSPTINGQTYPPTPKDVRSQSC